MRLFLLQYAIRLWQVNIERRRPPGPPKIVVSSFDAAAQPSRPPFRSNGRAAVICASSRRGAGVQIRRFDYLTRRHFQQLNEKREPTERLLGMRGSLRIPRAVAR